MVATREKLVNFRCLTSSGHIRALSLNGKWKVSPLDDLQNKLNSVIPSQKLSGSCQEISSSVYAFGFFLVLCYFVLPVLVYAIRQCSICKALAAAAMLSVIVLIQNNHLSNSFLLYTVIIYKHTTLIM